MIKLALLVILVIIGVKLFNGGLTVDIDGKTHSIEVKESVVKKPVKKKMDINDKLDAIVELRKEYK